MAFEEEFGCEIPDDAAETIQTVGDAIRFLEQNAPAPSSSGFFGPKATRANPCQGGLAA